MGHTGAGVLSPQEPEPIAAHCYLGVPDFGRDERMA